MTDLRTTSLPLLAAPATVPADAAASRSPYQTPRVQRLGEWTALTLVTSLPLGPGGMIFGGPTEA